MEPNQPDSFQNNWNQAPPQGQDIPGANASMILGIVGLFLSLCAGCGLVGFILSIIAFIKGKSAVGMYELNPSVYSEKSFKQAKAGKILGLIGLILGIVVIIILILLIVTGMLAETLDK